MLDELRKPVFFLALVLIVIAVLAEGAAKLLGVQTTTLPAPASGFGVPAMLLLDALLILTVTLMGLSLLLPERIQGRLQGLVTLIVSLLVLIASVVLIFFSIQLLTLMVSLLLAAPFGTIAYLAAWGDFDRGGAAVVLSLVLLLKLGFAICLVFAQQRFLENKGLVLLIATSLIAVLLLSFLHGFVPGILVSITDTVGALVIAVLTLIWAVIFLIGSVISVVKAVV
jgi:hypothetical protein